VGTLDSLLTLSDELSKGCLIAESAVGKIKRQLDEIGGQVSKTQEEEARKGKENSASLQKTMVGMNPRDVQGSLTVDGMPAEKFLLQFQWDEARYPTRRPLQETVNRLQVMTIILWVDSFHCTGLVSLNVV